VILGVFDLQVRRGLAQRSDVLVYGFLTVNDDELTPDFIDGRR
jgi:hypothetical protein